MLEVSFGACCNGKDMTSGGFAQKQGIYVFPGLQGQGAGLDKECVKFV